MVMDAPVNNNNMIYCRACGAQLHASALSCPHCGCTLQPAVTASSSPSVWMAATALGLSIFVLLDTLFADVNSMSQEELRNSCIGGLIFTLPTGVLGIVSLVQKRGGQGMAIASVIISGINLVGNLASFP